MRKSLKVLALLPSLSVAVAYPAWGQTGSPTPADKPPAAAESDDLELPAASKAPPAAATPAPSPAPANAGAASNVSAAAPPAVSAPTPVAPAPSTEAPR